MYRLKKKRNMESKAKNTLLMRIAYYETTVIHGLYWTKPCAPFLEKS